jgi:single-stranded-DNA-specific exonuclease
MQKRWLVNRTNPDFIQYLSKTASVSPIIAQILVNRGIKTAPDIARFLRGEIQDLSDPMSISGMQAAVERIIRAIHRKEKILIHGDYDVDGICATVILYQAIQAMGGDCCYFIPNRFKHGYGFNPEGVTIAEQRAAGLIITVDCGITALDTAALCRTKGIDLIVTDHHEPIRKSAVNILNQPSDADGVASKPADTVLLPDAVAVINPKLMADTPTLRFLSGAGIALKLVQALVSEGYAHMSFVDFVDLATLGTVADMVPLRGDNRIIVREGLSRIARGTRPGIKALAAIAGINGKEVKAGRLSFSLIPRMNAAGRLGDTHDVVEMLSTSSSDRAEQIAQRLDTLNTERQEIEEKMFQEAIGMLQGRDALSVIVIASESWHQGVNGIVASRLVEQTYRPAIVCAIEDGIAKGSARSIPSFDICTALADCSDLLLGFGGHHQAAGLRLEAANLNALGKKLCTLFDETEDVERIPSLTIDAGVSLADITGGLMREFRLLEPLGSGNPEPLFGSKMLSVDSSRIVGNNHLKMKLRQKSYVIDAIGFGLGQDRGHLDVSTTIDAVYTPSINEWNGRQSLQLIVKAFRPSL